MNIVLRFLGAVITHELAHILMLYYYTGKWPKIKLEWSGPIVGEKEQLKELTLRKHAIVCGVGPLAGLPWTFGSGDFLLIYIIMCFLDFAQIYGIINTKKEYWDIQMKNITIHYGDQVESIVR